MMTGKTRKDEIEIWKHGWKFNYLIGQLNYIANKYKKEITSASFRSKNAGASN
jgi:hypothetical protein